MNRVLNPPCILLNIIKDERVRLIGRIQSQHAKTIQASKAKPYAKIAELLQLTIILALS